MTDPVAPEPESDVPWGEHFPTTPVQCACGWRETDPDAGTWVEHMSADVIARLAEIDRNARAYGWEVGHGHPLTDRIESTDPANPFLDADWRARVIPPGEGQR